MRLAPGAVRPQLSEVFDELTGELMATYQLPESIEESLYWQILLDGEQIYAFTRDTPVGRSLRLLRKLVTFHRRVG